MKTFKRRFLQEDSYSGNSDLQSNWKKYALGAGVGALGLAAHHITGDDDDGGILDELKDAHQEGHLQDTLVDKTKDFVDRFRSNSDGGSDAHSYSGGGSDTHSGGGSNLQSRFGGSSSHGSSTDKIRDIVDSVSNKNTPTGGSSDAGLHQTAIDHTNQDLLRNSNAGLAKEVSASNVNNAQRMFNNDNFDSDGKRVENPSIFGTYMTDNMKSRGANELIFKTGEVHDFGPDSLVANDNVTPEKVSNGMIHDAANDRAQYEHKLEQTRADNLEQIVRKHGNASDGYTLSSDEYKALDPHSQQIYDKQFKDGTLGSFNYNTDFNQSNVGKYYNEIGKQLNTQLPQSAVANAKEEHDYIVNNGLEFLKGNNYEEQAKMLAELKQKSGGHMDPILERYFQRLTTHLGTK